MKKNYREKMIVKEWMLESLIQLMKTIPYEEITITQIAKNAGVPRMTYYRNYMSKDEILTSYLEYLTEEFASLARAAGNISNREFLKILFDFSLKYKDCYLALITNKKAHMMLDTINKNIETITTNSIDSFCIKFYAGAIFNVLVSWLQHGAEETGEEMAEILNNIINGNIIQTAMDSYNDFFNKFDNC